MKHIAQATKNRKVVTFVASLRASVRTGRKMLDGRNRNIKVGDAYRSVAGDRFEITLGKTRDNSTPAVLLVEVDKDAASLTVTCMTKLGQGAVQILRPVTTRTFRAFKRELAEYHVYLM